MLNTPEVLATLDIQEQLKLAKNEFSYMNSAEQQEWLFFKKLRANRLYRARHLNKAIESYLEALAGSLHTNDTALSLVLLCNLSSCMITLKEYSQAEKYIQLVLTTDPQHSRALERKAALLLCYNEHSQARDCLITALTSCRDPSLKSQIECLLESSLK